ncbi:hypothetical protein SIM91_00255 [Rhodococcus opacus]|nr:hypothetical protein [Rhodococcus opacus]MDX5961803.1 hypothetical protein [Rhodococcus opacus]
MREQDRPTVVAGLLAVSAIGGVVTADVPWLIVGPGPDPQGKDK